MRLYLDMDGVLMDFDSQLRRYSRAPKGDRTYHHLPRDQWTPDEVVRDVEHQAAMADSTFWRTMPPMRDAHQLWTFASQHHPRILTAWPAAADAQMQVRCAEDKLRSIHGTFDTVFPQQLFHACSRHEKARFAQPGAVLVDDMLPNCLEWEKAGGIAILHTSAADTINRLKEIHNV